MLDGYFARRLTGKTRFRLGWKKCLVLQVQYKQRVTQWSVGQMETEDCTIWGDATIEMMTSNKINVNVELAD